MRRFAGVIVALWASFAATAGSAQDFNALATVEPETARVTDTGAGLSVSLTLSQPVPYRVFTLADPMRLVVDFNEVDWRGIDADTVITGNNAEAVRLGAFKAGWSRMVVDLAAPFVVDEAGMTIGDNRESRFIVALVPASEEAFRAASGAPEGATYTRKGVEGLNAPVRRQTGERDLIIVLDPGHGGIDPGAEAGTKDAPVRESDLMLLFARELKEMLLRDGGYQVVLTREDDVFVPLETRVTVARAAKADVFISIHADALAEGRATGATIYTLSEKASDLASQKLAERHDRADLLAGVDLSDQGDDIATVLMDLARMETAPRSDSLADELVISLKDELGKMYKKPRLEAGFSVLKAPDIPSVLVELGFLSNPNDLADIQTPEWREKAQRGILAALNAWRVKDAAQAQLLRQ
ncbi:MULTISPECIES: N-acetylmuramoyl-L-alanine amidase [Halocynthiibacter]|uniref:N-acetylmuramoyl-L-alanine amidase n=1 Tax=Halocynthiibacter halioticoli TaxID=2986804 RepID=A0AAE3LQ56_9RHOB|nr:MULTISPECIES: N-acetylmuramoyl-L-alanine amidase [Halocynthiibacter]MCV6824127.1 N-acetylmuramoyl-L-alanine amidase [Halocynthiibacter halioticoli]MCW4057128.1 N-acetylmuramoyl-L-alanine amidase [Halocynthiibacter sp. SDUM655004]